MDLQVKKTTSQDRYIMHLDIQNQLLSLMEKYELIDVISLKNNIRDLLKKNGLKKDYLVSLLGVRSNTAYAYTNQANPNKIPLKSILKIAIDFKIDVEDLFINNHREKLRPNIAKTTRWTSNTKKLFIQDYERLGIDALSKKYNITHRTAATNYTKFRANIL
ncbi:hypothetical protein HZI73_26065 (plasmid) [Vallitalea pronyensis]|uniref:Uncharacterized protein n=1 Tax=Vallitalea pronyensis TaxID=1348613 RepID=A0A8J8MQV1_9FIRM|nr:hypothetical protein [Vallitalea pronyensis]QUI25881.1 hypothetical protein HZI73_26065 [Vallitalea pronyensis]